MIEIAKLKAALGLAALVLGLAGPSLHAQAPRAAVPDRLYGYRVVRTLPHDPGAFTQLQWRGITPSMFPRAGLDDDEAALVTDFLMRNASDAAVAN